jgi:hypothetical protein
MSNNARAPAAERMRLHRERRRRGLRCLMIELSETDVDALIRGGLLASKKRVTIGTPFSRRFIIISTEHWDRYRDAQQATDRLTIKDLRNDALNACELRAG